MAPRSVGICATARHVLRRDEVLFIEGGPRSSEREASRQFDRERAHGIDLRVASFKCPQIPHGCVVISRATNVEEYLRELPKERQIVIARLRRLARRFLKGYAEQIEYGMPHYRLDDQRSMAFASQKRYVALYVGEDIIAANRDRIGRIHHGRSCLRFPNPERIDWGLVEKLVRDVGRR